MKYNSNLARYLAVASGKEDGKNIAKMIPKELMHNDKPVRELILTNALESTTLVQTEIYKQVVDGAEPYKCYRDALPIFQCNGPALQVNYGETGTYASEVAEGAAIPIETQDYSARTFTIKKYGVRPMISRELVNDGLFDVVALEVAKSGSRLENKLNQLTNNTILEGSGNEHDTATTAGALGIKALASAIAVQKAAGFMPTDAVLTPGMAGYVMLDSLPTGSYWDGSAKVPSLLGVRLHTCGVADVTGGTYTWGSGTDGFIMGMVIDRMHGAAIAMREDITVENYKDYVNDLHGMSITMRFAPNYINSTAVTRIEY